MVLAGAKLATPFPPASLDFQMSISDSFLTSLPRHGGFYLLHPADSRAFLSNVDELIQQQETFQLWCQHKVVLITHCLRLLIDLEYNLTPDNMELEPGPGHTDGHIWTMRKLTDITRLRLKLQELLNFLRRYRFDHHRPDHFHQVPPPLYHRFLLHLSDSHMNCRDTPTRTRSSPARHRRRTYPRTALPFDYQMWQRGLSPQFDPDSESD